MSKSAKRKPAVEARAHLIAQEALRDVVKQLKCYRPVPSTLKGVDPVVAAECGIDLAVQIIEDLIEGTSRTRKTSPEHLQEMRLK